MPAESRGDRRRRCGVARAENACPLPVDMADGEEEQEVADDDGRHRRFRALFQQQHRQLRAFLGSALADWNLADDLLQEVAVVLWQRFDEIDDERSFGAFAHGIAVNMLRREFGGRHRRMRLLSPEAVERVAAGFAPDRDGTDEDDGDERLQALRRCLDQLTARTRRLLDLRYREGIGLEAVAERVDGNAAAVKKALTRARSQLHGCIERRLAREQLP